MTLPVLLFFKIIKKGKSRLFLKTRFLPWRHTQWQFSGKCSVFSDAAVEFMHRPSQCASFLLNTYTNNFKMAALGKKMLCSMLRNISRCRYYCKSWNSELVSRNQLLIPNPHLRIANSKNKWTDLAVPIFWRRLSGFSSIIQDSSKKES